MPNLAIHLGYHWPAGTRQPAGTLPSLPSRGLSLATAGESHRRYGVLKTSRLSVLLCRTDTRSSCRDPLWRFHGADGGGRCFPSYGKIAAAAKCARSTVAVALRELEDAGLLSWIHRIARIRRQERDLFDQLVTVWQVVRISNGYRFLDPLDRMRGRNPCKSENRSRPQNRDLKSQGARLDGARVMSEETSRAPLVRSEPPEVAPRREHTSAAGAKLSPAERAALITRLDTSPTKADWELYDRQLDAMITAK